MGVGVGWKVYWAYRYVVICVHFWQDNKTQFTVMTDRSQGGSSLQDGNIEVMVKKNLFSWIRDENQAFVYTRNINIKNL